MQDPSPPQAERKRRKPAVRDMDRYPLRRGFRGHAAFAVLSGLSRLLLDMRAEGVEHIPAEGPFLLCPNHETYLDGLWVCSFLPPALLGRLCSLAASDLKNRHGLLGRIMLRMGRSIPVDRFGNPVRALIVAKRQLEKGEIVLLHPEGTRSATGEFGEFKTGAAYLSVRTGAPILPVYLDGAYAIFNRHRPLPSLRDPVTRRRRILKIVFGRPLYPAKGEDAERLTERLRLWMDETRAACRAARRQAVRKTGSAQ